MGRKRKREEDTEKIAKKIKKLERKLKRKNRVISSDEDSDEEVQVVSINSPGPSRCEPLTNAMQIELSEVPLPDTIQPEVDQNLLETPEQTSNAEEDEKLQDDILQILGDEPQPEVVLGKDVHKDIASRWQDTLSKGLTKEVKESIMKKYQIPANCNFLIAPVLNPEAKAAVPDILAKRVTSLMYKQNQLGIALAALSQLMNSPILRNETHKKLFLTPLSDACRLICDSHYMETKTRRSIILSSINVNLRDALANADRDKYLFGTDLSEKLKAAKIVQKSGESLQKPNPIPSSSKVLPARNTPKNRTLNYKGLAQRKPPIRTNETTKGRPPVRQMHNPSYTRQAAPPPQKTFSQSRKTYR